MIGRSSRDADFTTFAQQATGPLGRTAWLLTASHADAADLVQAALVKTYVAWPRAQAEPLAYARRVLVNEHISRWRRRHGETAVGLDFDRPATGRAEDAVDDRDRLHRMLAELPPQQRAVVVLRYYEDLSESDVARHLGISLGAVKSAASRGLAALRANYSTVSEGELR